MTDFRHMNSPLEADFALGNLDRWLTRRYQNNCRSREGHRQQESLD
jgi:hypothetical protein